MHRNALALTLALGIGAILIATRPLHAEDAACGIRDRVLDHLAATYGERRQALGLAGASQMVEVYASDSTGTWTLLVTSASGVTCMVAAGTGFAIDPPPIAGDPA